MRYSEYLKDLIKGKNFITNSKYTIYCTDKSIKSSDVLPSNCKYISKKELFRLLYKDCKKVIKNFSRTSDNKDVYAISLYIDIETGAHGLWINNEKLYSERVKERYSDYSKNKLRKPYGVRYNSSDLCISYLGERFLSSKHREILNAYYCISTTHTLYSFEKDIAFDSSLIESGYVSLGLKVINRLKKNMGKLDKTPDFISYVSLHDVDEETILLLMRKSNSRSLIDKLFLH